MEHCVPVALGDDAEYIIYVPFPVFDWDGELRAQHKVFKILHVNVSNHSMTLRFTNLVRTLPRNSTEMSRNPFESSTGNMGLHAVPYTLAKYQLINDMNFFRINPATKVME